MLVGVGDNTDTIQAVTGLCISKDENLIVAVSSLLDYNPVYGIDAHTGEIKWKYRNPLFKDTCYITVDESDNIILAANNPVQQKIWFTANLDASAPPFDKINTTIGGGIILLNPDGTAKAEFGIPNECCLQFVTPDSLHGRLFIICSTYVKERSMLSSFLFVTDYDGNIIKGESVDMSMEVSVFWSEDNIEVADEYVHIGSNEGLKKIDLYGNLIEICDIFDKRIEICIYQTNYDERAIYFTGTCEQISEEYGRSIRIFKYKY